MPTPNRIDGFMYVSRLEEILVHHEESYYM